MQTLARDVRYALRTLLRTPSFTAIAVLTLALGIGANSAIFSVVDGVLLQPLAYEDADRLVAVFEDSRSPTSPANFLDWKGQTQLFEDATAAHPWAPVLRGRDRPEQLQGLRASPELFRLLGASAALGRTYSETQEGVDPGRVVVLGHEIWQRRFGGERELLGQTLSLDGEDYTVIGIMPAGFEFPPFWATEAELWAPLVFDPETRQERGARFLRVFARLQPGIGLERAQDEMTALAARLAAEYPDDNAGLEIRVEALREPVVSGIRGALWVVSGAVGLVLLVACANVANLFLVRASTRRREIAVRSALGAGRWSLARQLLTESAVLALGAGTVGLLLGLWGVEALVALSPKNIPRLSEIGLDGRVFAFTFGLSLVTGAVFGLFPVLATMRWNLRDALRGGQRQASGRHGGRLRNGLAAAEIALALTLLVGAGLLVKTADRLSRLDPGFRTEGVLTLDLSLSGSEREAPERQLPFFEELVEEVEAIPGVDSAALINHLPIGGDIWGLDFQIEGRRASSRADSPHATFRVASPGLFATLDVPILHGRAFDRRDREDSQPVVIVSQALVDRYWNGENPVGKRIQRGGPESQLPWMEIVGVAGDVRQWELTNELQPGLYFPYRQNPVSWFLQTSLVIHTRGEPEAIRTAVESRIWQLEPDVPISKLRTMEEILDGAVWRQRFNATLLALFAALAAVLAAIGIYGVMSYAVASRRVEIGVRMALGAGRRQISRWVVRQGLRIAVVGALAGVAGALLLARFVGSLLFEMSAYDPATFTVVSSALVAIALLACWLPARRASRLDPVRSLRSE